MKLETLTGRQLQSKAHKAGVDTKGCERSEVVAALRHNVLAKMEIRELRVVAFEVGLDIVDIDGHIERDRIVKRISRQFDKLREGRLAGSQPRACASRCQGKEEAEHITQEEPTEVAESKGHIELKECTDHPNAREREEVAAVAELTANESSERPSGLHTNAETTAPQASPPAFEELRFKRGDFVFRKGDLCVVVAAEDASQSYTLRVAKDGRLIDTPQEHLLEVNDPSQLSGFHRNAETPAQQTSPPAFEELRFKRGDRVFRKGELCEVVAAEDASQSYTVRVVQDGRLIDTPQEHLLAESYPSRLVREEDSCPICFRPVSGENCVRCCVRCEGSKFLHRQCLLGLMCQATCPRGHPLIEKKQATSRCIKCHMNRVGGIQWGCVECGTVCRWCVEETMRSDVRCPTCRTPLPSNKRWTEPLFTHHGEMPARRPVFCVPFARRAQAGLEGLFC